MLNQGHENTLRHSYYDGWYWTRRWENGDAKNVPVYTSKFKAWRPTQQRPRDGTIVRHKTGGLKRVS